MMVRKGTWGLIAGFIILLLVMNVSPAQGTEIYGVRALGMGGAFTAVADDVTTAYYNPAGLTRSGSFALKLAMGMEDNIADILGKDIDYSSDKLRFSNGVEIGDHLGHYDLFSGIQLGDFALSLVTSGDINSSSDGLEESYKGQFILSTSTNVVNSLALGMNLKGLMIGYREIRPETGEREAGEIEANKTGYSIDLGALYSLTSRFRVGVSAKDIHSDLEDWSGDDVSPEMTFTVGAAANLPLSTLVAADLEFDDQFEESSYRVGVESSLFPLLTLRAGAYEEGDDLVHTYGLGLRLAFIHLNYATIDNDQDYHKLSAQISF